MTKIKINKKIFFTYMVLLAYLKPYNITLIPSVDNIFKILKIVITMVILFQFIQKKLIINKNSIYLLCFAVTWGISVFINNAQSEFFSNILSIIGITLFFENNYHSDYFKNILLKALYNISACFIVLNFITVLLGYPFFASHMNLGDNANFLGGDNYSAFILITFAGFMFFYDVYSKGIIRKKTWAIAIIPLLGLLITFSLTGMVAYTILLVAVWVKNNSVKYMVFHVNLAVLFCFIFLIGVSYLHFDVLVSIFLNKVDKVGFNGRNMIWPMVISAIMKKPVLGYGAISSELAKTWFIAGANHAHNILLEFPFSTGIIGTVFFILYLKGVLKNIKQIYYNKKLQILLITLFAYIICSTFDFYIGMINLYLLLNMISLYKTHCDDSVNC